MQKPGGCGIGIEPICEAGFVTSGFVKERQRVMPNRQTGGNALGVFGGLFLDAYEGVTRRLGLDHPNCLSVYRRRVIRFTGLEGKLFLGDALLSGEIGRGFRLDSPAARCKLHINKSTGCLLWRIRWTMVGRHSKAF